MQPPATDQRPPAKTTLSLTGVTLAFVAGAVDAVGLQAVNRFSSHVSGSTSLTAGALIHGEYGPAALGICVLICFATGAALCSFLIGADECRVAGRRLRGLLIIESLLIALGLLAAERLHPGPSRTWAYALPLALAMGFQNNLSKRALPESVRTTHVTGTLTDLGSGLGGLIRARFSRTPHHAAASRAAKSALLFAGFLLGALCGFFCYGNFGSAALAVPIALLWLLAARASPNSGRPSRTPAPGH